MNQWRRIADRAGAVMLVAAAVFYATCLPQTMIIFDALKDWSLALQNLRDGQIPWQGTNITGVGNNAPWLQIAYMVALSVAESEWTMPAVGTALGLISTFWGWWLLRPVLGLAAVWPVLVFATNPMVFSWSRIGIDAGFFPILVPAFIAWWRLLDRDPSRIRIWFAGGVLMAVGVQVYVTFVPTVVVVGVFLAWRHRELGRLAAFVSGLALPFLPVLSGLSVGGPQLSYTRILHTLPALAGAFPGAMAADASVALPEFLVPVQLVGWAGMIAGLAGAFIPRLGTLTRLASIAAGFTLLLGSFDPASHYHHFAHMVVVIGLAWIVVGRILVFDSTRIIALSVVVVQLSLVVAGDSYARRTGTALYGGQFPVAEPVQPGFVSTVQARDAVFAVANKSGLDRPFRRFARIQGNRTLPYYELQWVHLSDSVPLGHGLVDGVFEPSQLDRPLYRLGTCQGTSERTMLAPDLCWSPAAVRPVTAYSWSGTGPVDLDLLRFCGPVSVKSEDCRARPLLLSDRKPDSTYLIQITANDRILVRSSLFPEDWRVVKDPVFRLDPSGQHLERRHGYLHVEDVYAFPAQVTEVTAYLRFPVFDLDVVPAEPEDTGFIGD